MRPALIFDILAPGAGLVLDGRVTLGLALLVPAIPALALLLLGAVLGGAIAAWVLPHILPVYLLLVLVALLLRWRFARLTQVDPVRARALARAAAQAWLRGQDAEATASARQLVRAAPEVANAWRLLALVSGDARAERRARAVEELG